MTNVDSLPTHFRLSPKTVAFLAANKVGLFAAALVILLVFVLVAAPLLAPYDPLTLNIRDKLQPPSAKYLLGTDEVGRDIFSRILFGGRTTLTMGLAVILSAATIGTIIGLVAGYRGGRIDESLMRLGDMFLGFPYLLLAMLIALVIGPGLLNAVVALTAAWWASYARLVRGMIIAGKHELYVEAAQAAGATDFRIAVRHVLPQCWGPLIVKMTVDVGLAMIAASSLSFIGLGPQAPSPDWGLMMADARIYALSAWCNSLSPGVALLLVAMGLNLLNDMLQDAIDPRRY